MVYPRKAGLFGFHPIDLGDFGRLVLFVLSPIGMMLSLNEPDRPTEIELMEMAPPREC